MAYGNAKVYFDGSHYIAIPHTERPSKHRYRVVEEKIVVVPKQKKAEAQKENSKKERAPVIEESSEGTQSAPDARLDTIGEEVDICLKTPSESENIGPVEEAKTMTRKELFDRLYEKNLFMKRSERTALILQEMLPYFEDEAEARRFVALNMQRRWTNLVARRIRMTRKINLQEFNFFCTFTYDDKSHTEDSFRRKLRNTLKYFCRHWQWKYIGVWERSPEKQRLHFHGLFDIKKETLPGMMIVKDDYSFQTHKRQETHQNTYFLERFGRNDFDPIEDSGSLGSAVSYLIKYIEKTGEKIVCSKNMPQFFMSDILESDVVTTYGLEDKKLLLFDDFSCFDQGCYVGQVSPEAIRQLRKSN